MDDDSDDDDDMPPPPDDEEDEDTDVSEKLTASQIKKLKQVHLMLM